MGSILTLIAFVWHFSTIVVVYFQMPPQIACLWGCKVNWLHLFDLVTLSVVSFRFASLKPKSTKVFIGPRYTWHPIYWAFRGNVAKQEKLTGGQFWKQAMHGNLIDAILLPTLKPMQVTSSDGQILIQVAF